ncbi:MAG TPA: pitrilysin family protein [Nitrospiria bacterium]|nr:pitrilysin family protein [Nitrospiria bacterium]
MSRARLLLPLLLFFFSPLFLFDAANAAKIQETTLSNGMKVILQEEHKAPVVTFQIWYKVGSRNEVTGKTGLSHLTEHMMFKGTKKHGKGEFSRIVAKNGGNENAFTGNNYTAYFENFAADRIGLSLELEPDRMQNLLVDPKEFLLERDVVKEERRMRTDDDPESYLIENLYAIAYMAHPYHNPVIGWMTDIGHLTRDELYRHYKTYYVPNNATVVVVGDFDAKVLLPRIEKAFGSIPKGPELPKVEIVEPEQVGERRTVVRKEAQLPFVIVGYHSPNFKSPDVYALSVLANLLSSGKSSRLYRSLVYDQQIAIDAGGSYDGLSTDPELFYVYAVARPGKKPEDLETALYAEIEKIKEGPISDTEMTKAKNQVEADYIMGQDSNFFEAMQLGTAETVGAGVGYVEHYVENIRKVTSEDVRRVARTYFIKDHRNVGTLIPIASNEATAPSVKGE